MSETRIVKVTGMSCSHCERAVERAVSAIEGVESAKADHVRGEVTLSLAGPVADEALAEAVKEAGYQLG